MAVNDFIVRRAQTADAAGMAELSGILGYPADRETMRSRLEKLSGREEHVVLVAEINGEVVGWIHGAEQPNLVADRIGEICGLVVADGRRTGGIGRRLVEEVEQWARGRGLDQVSVRSNIARTESHPFYERVGYVCLKTQHAYRKRLNPPPGS
ncbi:MAG TPA: GNAT family N-acetyltransferase [Chthoniobacterales bacterium]|nr:GNAT family N-acetyltransferase [Chthoniobacterales bacterium]